MRFVLPVLLILTFAAATSAQTEDKAVPQYSINEKLISLSNLEGLSDCTVRSVQGRVVDLERGKDFARITIKIDKKNQAVASIPLHRVADEDKRPLFKHLITKKNTIRVSGYACSEDAPFSVFSIDRVY